MRVLFLGTGTSHGVPTIGCDCAVCQSGDSRDRRFRTSIYVTCDDGLRVLVDTTPDLRMQALTHNIRRIDAVLLTHSHVDHLMGLDEIRRFNTLSGRPIPLYATDETLADVRRTFAYAFRPDAPKGGGVPELLMRTVSRPFVIEPAEGVERLERSGQPECEEIVPVPVQHGPWTVLGYRFGRFAYLTDCNAVSESSQKLLAGVDTLVLDALRHAPHPTHFTLAEAVAMARTIGARQTYFTHIAHDLPHAATSASLPAGMTLAYDGLTIEVVP